MKSSKKVDLLKDKIKRGSYVRLSNNLEKSIKGFGGRSAKTRMQGTVQRVYKKWSRYVSVEEGNNGTHWTIYYGDIDEIVDEDGEVIFSTFESIKSISPPELFDPANLI